MDGEFEGGKVKEAQTLAGTTTWIPHLRFRNRASLDLVWRQDFRCAWAVHRSIGFAMGGNQSGGSNETAGDGARSTGPTMKGRF
jgi:hypothetical protein